MSIDLCGLVIKETLITQISDYCPKVECIYINKTKFIGNSWLQFILKIASNLMHLSIDNSIEIWDPKRKCIDFELLFKNCQKLEELKLIDFMDKRFDPQCFRHIANEKLVF